LTKKNINTDNNKKEVYKRKQELDENRRRIELDQENNKDF